MWPNGGVVFQKQPYLQKPHQIGLYNPQKKNQGPTCSRVTRENCQQRVSHKYFPLCFYLNKCTEVGGKNKNYILILFKFKRLFLQLKERIGFIWAKKYINCLLIMASLRVGISLGGPSFNQVNGEVQTNRRRKYIIAECYMKGGLVLQGFHQLCESSKKAKRIYNQHIILITVQQLISRRRQ